MKDLERDAAELRRRLESPELMRKSIADFAGIPLRQTVEAVPVMDEFETDETLPSSTHISDSEFERLLHGDN